MLKEALDNERRQSAIYKTAGGAQVSYTLPATTPPVNYTIEATYTDAGGTFAPSSDDSHTLTVAPITTTTKVSATPAQPTAGQSVTLTATVGATAAPTTGTVGFSASGTALAGCGAVPIPTGTATCTTTLPAAGSVTVDAAYRDVAGGIFLAFLFLASLFCLGFRITRARATGLRTSESTHELAGKDIVQLDSSVASASEMATKDHLTLAERRTRPPDGRSELESPIVEAGSGT